MPGCLTACCLSRVLVPLKRAQAKSQKHQINLVQLILFPFPFVYTYILLNSRQKPDFYLHNVFAQAIGHKFKERLKDINLALEYLNTVAL